MKESLQYSESLPWAVRWTVRLLVLLMVFAMGWVLEDRYGLISGTDVRLRVICLEQEIRSDGDAYLVCKFEMTALKWGIYSHLCCSHFEFPSATLAGDFPETSPTSMSAYAINQHFRHIVRPSCPEITVELPLQAPAAWQAVANFGQQIRLKRGHRVVIAKYRPSEKIRSGVAMDQDCEITIEIR